MNQFSPLLHAASREILAFAETAEGSLFPRDWLELLATHFEGAASVPEASVDAEMERLAYAVRDSGPLNAAPSFDVALAAHQRAKQRRRVK